MKSRIMSLAMVVICMISTSLNAQKSERLSPTNKLEQHIDLSQDQKQQIEAIEETYDSKLASLEMPEDKVRMRSIRKDMRAEVRSVLNTEQKEILEQKKIKGKEEKRKYKQLRKSMSPEDRKTMRSAVKTHRQTVVMPKLQAERALFENQIDLADKDRIAYLRTEMKRLKKEDRANRKSAGAKGEKKIRKRGAFKKSNNPHYDEISALVDKYDDKISRHLVKMENERKGLASRSKRNQKGIFGTGTGACRQENESREKGKNGKSSFSPDEPWENLIIAFYIIVIIREDRPEVVDPFFLAEAKTGYVFKTYPVLAF